MLEVTIYRGGVGCGILDKLEGEITGFHLPPRWVYDAFALHTQLVLYIHSGLGVDVD